MAPGSRSRSAASAIRQPVRNAIGGSPTSSWKRRASVARETPASSASSATVHGWAGLWWSSAARGRRPGRRARGTSPARRRSGRANQARSTAISSRSSRRSSTASWPGLVLDDLVASSGITGQSHSSSRRTSSGGSARSSRPADLAVEVVGADEHHGLAVGGVAPGAHAEVHLLHSGRPSRVSQRWPGWITMCGARGRVVGDRVGLGPRTTATSPGASGPARRRRAAPRRRRAPSA